MRQGDGDVESVNNRVAVSSLCQWHPAHGDVATLPTSAQLLAAARTALDEDASQKIPSFVTAKPFGVAALHERFYMSVKPASYICSCPHKPL